MWSFFKGWRRKLGVVVLGLACVLMLGWVRSREIIDTVGIRRGEGPHIWLESSSQRLLLCLNYNFSPGAVCVTGWHADKMNAATIEFGKDWMWKLEANVHESTSLNYKSLVCAFPYWSIVIPLTLLSGYLLLSTLRPKPTQPGTHA